MNKLENHFSWIKTHQELVKYLSGQENNQAGLIELLKKQEISALNDQDNDGKTTELNEIDPFTFFCYIYKHGPERRLKILQDISKELNIHFPTDDSGIPSANAQKVWLFPYKFNRKNNEIKRLWDFFRSAIEHNITDREFSDILQIKNTAKTKLTEALFYVDPIHYLPINGPTKPYLKEVLKIEPEFNTYTDYKNILDQVKEKTEYSFYEISYEAWLHKNKNCNYWIFQCNPEMFDLVTALDENLVETWTVTAHKDKIKEGDKAIIWMTGEEAGCYALADVIGEPELIEKSKDDHLWKGAHKSGTKVKIEVTHNFSDEPILKTQISGIKSLLGFKGGNQGTNFQSSKEEYETFLSLTQEHHGVRFWLYSPGENAAKWNDFYEKGIMGLGWDKIGDLKQYRSRLEIKNALANAYGGEGSKKNDVSANDDFINKMNIGDVVIVKKGRSELLGYGIVASDYYFDEKKIDYKSCRKIDWKLNGTWKVDFSLVLKTLTDITVYPSEHPDYNKYHERLMGIMLQNSKTKNTNLMSFPLNTIFYGPPGTGKTYHTIKRAAEIISGESVDNYNEALKIFNEHLGNRIEFITFHQNYSYEDFIQGLRPDTENGNQLTFQKKDGIFKKIADKALENLRLSEKAPSELTNEAQFNIALDAFQDVILEKEDNFPINDSAYIFEVEEDAFRYTGEKWTNHTNGLRMKFNDLREFYRNKVASRKDIQKLTSISGLASQHATYYFLVYEQIIKYLPKEIDSPQKVEKQNYVIIIDEINRANISRVFGELITLIEPDKRSHGEIPLQCTLPSGDEFIVPSNLYIIGTMNTADKSIALLDIALRRRFEFESMYPLDYIPGKEIYDVAILKKINESIIKKKGHDFQIGHAYFMDRSQNLTERMNKRVIPLLMEYFMNDEKEVTEILKSAALEVDSSKWPLQIMASS